MRVLRGQDLTPFNSCDLWLSKIPTEGIADPLYMKLKEFVRNKPTELNKDDPLEKYEGLLPKIFSGLWMKQKKKW